MNWLLIAVGLIFLVGLILGAVKGFFRIGISLIAAVLTIVLVSLLTPYISAAIIKWTPADEMIEKKCVDFFMPSIKVGDLSGVDLSQTPLANYDTQELADLDLDELGLEITDITQLLGELPKDAQIKIIEDSEIPDFLKDSLLENNNSEIYKEFGVNTFPEYVASYVSNMAINVVSFLVTFLFVSILVKALIVAVDLLSVLPLVHGLNRIAGAVLGLGFSLIIIWVGFLVITLIYTTEIGKTCFEMISENALLTFLYEKNILLGILFP